MSAQRPISPHLQVYRPQITSVLSIMHRITGLLLCLGSLILLGWIASVAAGPECHDWFVGLVRSIPGRLLLLGFVFSLLFHWSNGIRHLFWDMGKGFGLDTTTVSGWSVVAFSVLGTLYVGWCLFGGAA